MPARKYWGRKTKLKIWFDALVSDIVSSRSRLKAPPMRQESSATGSRRATCVGVMGTRSIQAISTKGSTLMMATTVYTSILHITLDYGEAGETNTFFTN